MKDPFGGYVEFANASRSVASLFQQHWQRRYRIKRAEMVLLMLQSVHAVGMILQTRQQNRPAGTATSRCAERICETGTIGSQSINMGRSDRGVSVTTNGFTTMIVGHNQHNIRAGFTGLLVGTILPISLCGKNEGTKKYNPGKEMDKPDLDSHKHSVIQWTAQ
jgi:hypothetical protein